MDYRKLFQELKDSGDAAQSKKMSAYMRDQFLYLGVPTPKRRIVCKEFFREAKKTDEIDWNFIKHCWGEPCRELQYVAVDYLTLMKKHLTPSDVPKIRELAIQKSWWDTVDGLDTLIGDIALYFPEVNETLLKWSMDENIWLRRIAIDHQLSRKDKTDTKLLERIIINNLGQSEFFINKAIGWSLREYSKTNPDWVRSFVESYREKLAPLSIREASKYI